MTYSTTDSQLGEIAVFESSDGEVQVEVRFDQSTVWLSQRQIAEVFDTSTDNVGLHLKKIYADEELLEDSTTEYFSVVQIEGKRTIRRNIRHYNLDAILSVGYRVNSKRGVIFRQWATHKLLDHIKRGYTLNETRLAERGIEEAQETLNLLAQTLNNQELVSETGQAVLDLIIGYADTWRLLLEYDEDRLTLPQNSVPAATALDYDSVIDTIDTFRRDLAERGEATPLFGNLRDDALEGILGNIEQTMFGKPLYRSREEKAANLLYFIVKDHPFTDGNKRIGTLLFLLYLKQEGIARILDPRALTALTLLIAESAPESKDLMIRLIVNLLAEPAP